MLKRCFDLVFSIFSLVLFSPVLLVISILIAFGSRGGIFYRQIRVGKDRREFTMLKFRTMRPDSDKLGLLTVGGHDSRITAIGYFLRKYKLDELPQLLNVLSGDMSVVGPRPEVPRYVALYTGEQLRVLSVRPGITDYASIDYIDENEVLAKSSNPEQTYIHEVMPAKLLLYLKYIDEQSFMGDLKIILNTFLKIFR